MFTGLLLAALAAALGTRVDAEGVLRWSADGREVAAWGVNYYPPFSLDYHAIQDLGLDHKAVIREDVAHFRLLGVDCIRLLCFDRQISTRDGHLVDNENLELLDYLIAHCASNGIGTVLTPIAWWGGIRVCDGFSKHYSMEQLVKDRSLWPVQERYLREFVAHRNRYTGHAYGDDPAVMFFECINEPIYAKDVTDEHVTEYANTLAAAIRTGTRKPVFYNSWHGRNKAVGASSVDGVTGGYYPTGLVAGRELPGPHLATLYRPTSLEPDAHIARKAKAIYEFDAADTEGAYMYPAIARLFRHEGAQMASMFQYDPAALADRNKNWQTHHLNLVYTPRKAVSFLIGGEAFRRLPRGCPFAPSDVSIAFPPFRVDASRDLSEMATATDYLYSCDPVTPPPAPEKLRRVVGTGRSAVAESSGTGAYFLLRRREGAWDLRLFPSVFPVADAFVGGDEAKVVKSSAAVEMAVRLPDLGRKFVVRDANRRGRFVARTVDGRMKLFPGRYFLVRSDVAKDKPEDTELLDVDDFFAHPPRKAEDWGSFRRGTDDRGNPSLVFWVEKGGFTDKNPARHVGFHREALPLAMYFPGLGPGRAVRIRARAVDAKTRKMEVLLSVSSRHTWAANVDLSEEWREIEVPVSAFRYFSTWDELPEGTTLDLGRIWVVRFGIGRWLLGQDVTGERGIEVSSVRPVF
ncbi:MAG: hypothetical protein IKE55_00295 [Kiritimatiellae bacterium]|nr:hypothetical protein [Kiritimatiellia bacterium]